MTLRGEVMVKHGYDLNRLRSIAHIATRRFEHGREGDFYQAAYDRIVEAVLQAQQPPTTSDLINTGRRAARAYSRSEMRLNGHIYNLPESGPHSSPRFWRYWDWVTHPYPDHAIRVTDRVALWQCWAELRPIDQQALLALASCGTYEQAAEALGITYKALILRVGKARHRFFALWYEPDRPPRARAMGRTYGRTA
jgi:hypothetical protein